MWLFWLMPLLAFFLMGVVHASSSLDKVRLHWNEYRCNPLYIPFAGAVRPDIGVEENFQHCMNMFGQNIFKFAVDAIMAMFKDLTSGLGEVTTALPGVRTMLSGMRTSMLSFTASVFGKITNSTSSVSFILIKIRDVLKRFAAQGWIATFLSSALIDSAFAFVTLCMSIIKGFVIGLLATSAFLSLFQPELLAFALTISALLTAAGFM
jgi:hypothetical protein